jgi:hypothetical protein
MVMQANGNPRTKPKSEEERRVLGSTVRWLRVTPASRFRHCVGYAKSKRSIKQQQLKAQAATLLDLFGIGQKDTFKSMFDLASDELQLSVEH